MRKDNPQNLSFPISRMTIEREHVIAFARATGQTAPIHLDPSAARAAGHPDVVVPPTYAFCLEELAEPQFSVLNALGIELHRVLHGMQRFEYRRELHAGDAVALHSRIGEHYVKQQGALEFIVQHTHIFLGSDLAAELQKTIIVRHRAAAS